MKKILPLATATYVIAASLCFQATEAQKFTPSRTLDTYAIAEGQHAGSYPCPDAIGIAKELTRLGITNKEIKLIRPDENGKNVEITINLEKIRKHEIPDLLIRPGDTFYPKHGKVFKVFNVLTFGILGKVKNDNASAQKRWFSGTR